MRKIFALLFLLPTAASSSCCLKRKIRVFAFSEHMDLTTNSFFLSFYFGNKLLNRNFIIMASNAVPQIINQFSSIAVEITDAGDTSVLSNTNLYFSKRIYIYLEDPLPLSDMSEIEKCYAAKGYNVSIRSDAYESLHKTEYDRHPKGVAQGADRGPTIVLPSTGSPNIKMKVISNLEKDSHFEVNVPMPLGCPNN